MQAKVSKYLFVETAMSGLVNGILNFAAAFAIFHGRSVVPASGPSSLLKDTIGETFLVTALSTLIPTLIARQRRRAGTLPTPEDGQPTPISNIYIRSIVIGLIFTVVCVSCNAMLFPRLFPDGVSFRTVLLFKTLYGAFLGSIATFFALQRALNEGTS